ncbi:MAG: hypothetical protein WAV21_03010 [Minisyncoccia bacterium]
MDLVFIIRRGQERIPTIHLGNGLLRPLSMGEFFAEPTLQVPTKAPSAKRNVRPNLKMARPCMSGTTFGGNHSHEEKIVRRVTEDDHFGRPHLKYRCWKDWRQSQYYH